MHLKKARPQCWQHVYRTDMGFSIDTNISTNSMASSKRREKRPSQAASARFTGPNAAFFETPSSSWQTICLRPLHDRLQFPASSLGGIESKSSVYSLFNLHEPFFLSVCLSVFLSFCLSFFLSLFLSFFPVSELFIVLQCLHVVPRLLQQEGFWTSLRAHN